MNFQSLIMTPSLATAVAVAASALALALWWFVRKRLLRVWLPTIRVIQMEARTLPRLKFSLPPFVAFICFLAAALALCFFTLRPREQIFTPFEPKKMRIHVFLDMSPSVSAFISTEDYATRAVALWQNLSGYGQVSVSTSHDDEVREYASSDELKSALLQLGFHRAGLRLGNALKKRLDQLGELDRLIIVSDRDEHSWNGFNWRYLLDEMDVRLLDLAAGSPSELKNVFLNAQEFLSTQASPTMDWDIEIARRGVGKIRGELSATYLNKTLITVPWEMVGERNRLTLRASWPVTEVEAIAKANLKSDDAAFARSMEPLIWTVTTGNEDLVSLDNTYRSFMRAVKKAVLIFAEPSGERLLEDSVHQLQTALEILGFSVKRFDYVEQPGPPAAAYPFWILIGGSARGVDRFCPASIESARLHGARTNPFRERSHGAKSLRGEEARLPRVWLAPQSLDADYQELCTCLARLVLSTSVSSTPPSFCANISTRDQWLGLLPSLGAKQIGGQLGDAQGSLAWVLPARGANGGASDLQVLAFTVPLRPDLATGITHAILPMLVRQLVTWNGFVERDEVKGEGDWPRITDISAALRGIVEEGSAESAASPRPSSFRNARARVILSNVPLGESMLTELAAVELPPSWSGESELAERQLSAKRDRDDPLPWLRFAALLVVGAAALEALWWAVEFVFVRRLKKRERAYQLGMMLILGSSIYANTAFSQVQLNLVGYPPTVTSFATLARETAYRTSIDLHQKPRHVQLIGEASLSEPWLWTYDVTSLLTPANELRADIVLWIKRGGLLVIEGVSDSQQLSAWTSKSFKFEPGAPRWQPIPPDHELMRSFYLLDALPSCMQTKEIGVWHGFHFDGRLAIVAIPYRFIETVQDGVVPRPCKDGADQERTTRVFINMLMVALSTDYKKDQIHLPEILKRLR